MIRQLTKADDEICQQLIQQQPAENLFIIGDIEAYGYEQDFQKIWGDFDDEGQLRAVLLKYEKNFLPYANSAFDAVGFAKIINQDDNGKMLSGLKHVTEQLEPFIDRRIANKKELYYAKCTDDAAIQPVTDLEIKLVTVEDLPRLKQLLTSIPEFENIQFEIETKKRNMEKGVTRAYYVEEDGEMVSTAATTAENSKSAMIVGVGTDKDYKKRGYATKCVSKLCQDVLAEGKELCLFYDNPDAGKIYKRIGFRDIGFWTMYYLD
ncbi:GNAT family N-acetyltransferase [Aquibacillus koreensis]|uniref:GNAT family N-acetyltransferase n=1 Tax=Aquibacillus koreensis TaxID=279446 RepID=A0A9X3WL11_9BACI|nr:GNAT family N-acetyltransferase [Aquibacillus koreensis]MCT2538279.1 GNAT family N-acetyltransferase [Aquibacillus koreensis]MDC3420778.1 GNAT family N-acetyltransferase [Aquibacillus koreensis]